MHAVNGETGALKHIMCLSVLTQFGRMYGVLDVGWVGVQILNPSGCIPLREVQPSEWLEILLWVAYACLTYHGCDTFV